MNVGPDGARYLAAAQGLPVPRPFHLRWYLPAMCGTSERAWWIACVASWAAIGPSFALWRAIEGDTWQMAVVGAVALLALPGILGPRVVTPVGVDITATAFSLAATALVATGRPHLIAAGVIVCTFGAMTKETAPIWTALWAWSPWPLIALAAVAIRAATAKPGPDPLGPTFQAIADHPIRSALEHHRGQWRNAWVMLAPWGIGVAALVDPTPQVLVTVAVAYLQLAVATDTVRLLHHAAGPVVIAAAVANIPSSWLLVALAAHGLWWRAPERV